MAIIGKIREKSYLLLILIGVALMAFVLGDFFSNQSAFFAEDRNNIAIVDGVSVTGAEFENRLNRAKESYKENEQRNDVPPFVERQLREQIWNDLLDELLLGGEYEELGLVVSRKELFDMAVGENPHPQIKRAFTNPETGEFSVESVKNFIRNLDQDETGETEARWKRFEKGLRKERIRSKYNTLMAKGLYVTTLEAKNNYQESGKSVNIKYVVRDYSSIPDSTVEVSESDIRAYYDAKPYEFQEKKSRKIIFASFPVIPSMEDSARAKDWMENKYKEFAETDDDSIFININSEEEFDFNFYSSWNLPEEYDSALFTLDTAGYLFPMKLDNQGVYKAVKLAKIKYAPDSVRSRIILKSFQNNKPEDAEKLIDSIADAINNGADFAEIAKTESDDEGSAQDGGDLGWFQERVMPEQINDSSFMQPVGKLIKIEAAYGVLLLEVMEKSEEVKKIQLAKLMRTIEASKETFEEAFKQSSQFSRDLSGTNDALSLGDKYGTEAREIFVREDDDVIPGIENSRPIVRWAYRSNEGDVSETMEVDDGFVVAKLLEIKEDGTAPFDKVKFQAELGAIKDKKAEKFIEEMSGITSLEDATGKFGINPATAQVNFGSYTVTGVGREPELQGKVFTMDEGDLSVPIKGEKGVFIVLIESISDVAEIDDYKYAKLQLNQNRKSRAGYEAFEAIKKRVDIDDRRSQFY